ncbi:hypothetical protein [Methylosinus sporium]
MKTYGPRVLLEQMLEAAAAADLPKLIAELTAILDDRTIPLD